MPIGFLKSGRQNAPARNAPGAGAAGEGPAETTLRPARGRVLEDVEQLGIGMFWATDAAGALTFLSAPALRDFEAAGQDPFGQQLSAIMRDADALPGSGSQRALAFKCKTHARIDDHIVELQFPRPGSDEPMLRWWRLTGRPLSDAEGTFLGYRGSAVDITAQYSHEVQVARQSQIDELTGLANRRKLGERLTATLAAFRQTRRCCALIMLDLDRFKQVNDTMGHHAGDELLQQVARRLTAVMDERGEIGRLGGDEFQILLPDVDDRGTLAALANRIVQALSQPYQISGKRAIIGCSVGIAIAPYDGVEASELTRAADMALYAAKESRGTFRFYTAELSAAANRAAQLAGDLRDAAETGELYLAYQPLVDPVTNEVKCFEALLRWEHPEQGEISPGVFIPIAEENDLIITLGEMALRQACIDAQNWPGNIHVAVNVSAKQFMKPYFHKRVADVLKTTGLCPSRLELEITESVFVGDLETVDAVFRDLRKLGVRLVLDDFGTGYSSLGYLKHGHFDKIKIDQSFVRGCTESGDTNPAIITAIVALARALGMETVAEGVEAMDELALVRERGADLVQGYIFSRAITQAEVLAKFGAEDRSWEPVGPPRHRAERITILRKVGLIHEDHYYDVILRNMSKTGARIVGLAGVPVGTDVVLDLGNGQLVVSKVANSTENSQGLQFETPLISDGCGGFMTRHRISPYALAEAGIPLAALGAGAFPLAKWRETQRSIPKFVQLELGS
jgi:diguanylate cyclase (GGDEF)-like protein